MANQNTRPTPSSVVADSLRRAWSDFCDNNPDDLTSPEDLPDHALMTCDQFVQYATRALSTPAQVEVTDERPWVARIHEALDEGDGFWRSCSGCHELNEGYPTGDYSAAFRTHVGCGCSECGGLGVVWDDTDYADMGDYLAALTATDAKPARQETIGHAIAEYYLVDNLAGEAEKMGRRSAIRGLMVRLGMYDEFVRALEAGDDYEPPLQDAKPVVPAEPVQVFDEQVRVGYRVLMRHGLNAPEQVIFRAFREAMEAALEVGA